MHFATDYFLEPIAVWNWLSKKLLESVEISRRFTLRYSSPLPIPPLCPSLPARHRYLTFFGLIGSALVLSPLLSLREQASRVACPGCLYLADAQEQKKDAACWLVAVETACDALCSIAEGAWVHGPDICCHSYKLCTGNA